MHGGALVSMEIKNTKIKSTNSYKEFETEEKFKQFLQSSDKILYHIELNRRTERGGYCGIPGRPNRPWSGRARPCSAGSRPRRSRSRRC